MSHIWRCGHLPRPRDSLALVSCIGLRKAFWVARGRQRWPYELECKGGDPFNLRSYRDATHAGRNWSEHRKIGKLNRKRMRRESAARDERMTAFSVTAGGARACETVPRLTRRQ